MRSTLPGVLVSPSLFPKSIFVDNTILRDRLNGIILRTAGSVTVSLKLSLAFTLNNNDVAFATSTSNSKMNGFVVSPARSILTQKSRATGKQSVAVSKTGIAINGVHASITFSNALPGTDDNNGVALATAGNNVRAKLLSASIYGNFFYANGTNGIALGTAGPIPSFLGNVHAKIVSASNTRKTNNSIDLIIGSPSKSVIANDVGALTKARTNSIALAANNNTVRGSTVSTHTVSNAKKSVAVHDKLKPVALKGIVSQSVANRTKSVAMRNNANLLRVSNFVSTNAKSNANNTIHLIGPNPVIMRDFVLTGSIRTSTRTPRDLLRFGSTVDTASFVALSDTKSLFAGTLAAAANGIAIVKKASNAIDANGVATKNSVTTAMNSGNRLLLAGLLTTNRIGLAAKMSNFLTTRAVRTKTTNVAVAASTLRFNVRNPNGLTSPKTLIVRPTSPSLPVILNNFIFRPFFRKLCLGSISLTSLTGKFDDIAFNDTANANTVLLGSSIIFDSPAILAALNAVSARKFDLDNASGTDLALRTKSKITITRIEATNGALALINSHSNSNRNQIDLSNPMDAGNNTVAVRKTTFRKPKVTLDGANDLGSNNNNVVLSNDDSLDPNVRLSNAIASNNNGVIVANASANAKASTLNITVTGAIGSNNNAVTLAKSNLATKMTIRPNNSIGTNGDDVSVLAGGPLLTNPILNNGILAVHPISLTLPFALNNANSPARIFLGRTRVTLLNGNFDRQVVTRPGRAKTVALSDFDLDDNLTIRKFRVIKPGRGAA